MIERLFDLVKRQTRPMKPKGGPPSSHGIARQSVEHRSKIGSHTTQQNPSIRRLHRHMKRDPSRLVAATLRTGFLVGLAAILILILFPAAIAAQAAGLR
jgi:hypothetical protein